MIEDLDHPVGRYVDGEWFESEHNREITWHHLLNQTSGIPDIYMHVAKQHRKEYSEVPDLLMVTPI